MLEIVNAKQTENFEVAGWVRNADDRVYKNYAFDASRFTGLVVNSPASRARSAWTSRSRSERGPAR